jgi:hypothetical protein
MNTGRIWEHYGTGSWQIHDERAKLAVRGSGQDVIAADAGAADVTLTCEMLTPTPGVTGMDAGLVVRLVDNDNYWLVAYYPDQLVVYKKSAGAYKQLVGKRYDFKPKTAYRMKITLIGATLTAYVNATQQAQVTMDDFLKATRFGLRDHSAPNCQPSWDNFRVTAGE